MDTESINQGRRAESEKSTAVRTQATRVGLAELRSRRLLDMSGRNAMISSPILRKSRSQSFIRIIGDRPVAVFEALQAGRTVHFAALPPLNQEPEDEKTPEFERRLAEIRNRDQTYIAEMDELPVDEHSSMAAVEISRRLRDRVRAEIGMAPWAAPAVIGLEDWARHEGIDPSFEQPFGSRSSSKITPPGDVKLQTLMLTGPMDRQLGKLLDTTRTTIEETGVNTMHAVFGYLEWYESDSSNQMLLSPLLLIPVDIQKKMLRSAYKYSVVGNGSELLANEALSERLYRDFHIRLPQLEDGTNPETYCAQVTRDICGSRARWKVRTFVTIGTLSLARVTMYHDLDEEKWESIDRPLPHHGIISTMLGGGGSGSMSFAEDFNVESPGMDKQVPLLVLKTDASQHSAVADVMSGRSLVIEGPPGTGKSRTIANIIAAALHGGRKVLFVAEKGAALQVVKERLARVGLGDFCLEIHSGKANKKDIIESLGRRLDRQPGIADQNILETKRAEMVRERDALNNYSNTMNALVGASGKTVNQVLWGDRQRRNGEGVESNQLDPIRLPNARSLTVTQVEKLTAKLRRLQASEQEIAATHGSTRNHPWHGVSAANVSPVDYEWIARIAANAAEALQQVSDVCINLIRSGPIRRHMDLRRGKCG